MSHRPFIFALLLLWGIGAPLRADVNCDAQISRLNVEKYEIAQSELHVIEARVASTRYPEIPSVEEIHLARSTPQTIRWDDSRRLSSGLKDPLLEEARQLGVVDDFKPLSDLRPLPLSEGDRTRIEEEGLQLASKAEGEEARKIYLRHWLESAYGQDHQLSGAPEAAPPLWRIETGNESIDSAFRYTEETWSKLAKRTPDHKAASLLPSPYPVLIAAQGRFHESYYWDTYFGMKGLLKTGRLELAQMQVENMLEAIRQYGIIPNGMRDYYLSRSQPPFISSMTREIFDASMKASPENRARMMEWLEKRALPLIEADYKNFWMSEERFDSRFGLNHYSDDIGKSPRPERSAHDKEEDLGRTYRDVRAAAESGLDFTQVHQGAASEQFSVLLNSMLFKTEKDLAAFHKMLGHEEKALEYEEAANKRKAQMEKYLWNEEQGRYQPYHPTDGSVNVLSAEAYAPLFVRLQGDPGSLSEAERARVERMMTALSPLESSGGIKASEYDDSKMQWDGNNGWAPFQIMAMDGLRAYGHEGDARRIAQKWTQTIADVHTRTGVIYERYNVESRDVPQETGDKYPIQEGFLWTNGSFVWTLTDVLGAEIKPRTPASVSAH